ncbi:CD48 antigen-like [Xenopus laevis]|uniref:CD48 antigen-like n=1 Tax=Xenopus laevis TaxID=8355 RepID=A0A8J1LMN6_XENLA|nr:CD48 antigen-like [Xenopus laevis]
MCCFSYCLLLLLLLLLSLDYGCTNYNGQDKEYKTIKGTIGKPLYLPSNITNPNLKHWLKKVTNNARTKILLYDPKNKEKYVSNEVPFRFNTSKMVFEILRVQRKHEGRYIIIEEGDGELELDKFHIKVYEPITNVSIGQTETPMMNDSCLITLNCTTLGGDDVIYNWTQNREYLQNNSSVLEVTLLPDSASVSYTCRATNPVSHGFASINPLATRCSTKSEQRWDILLKVVVAILLAVLALTLLTVLYIYQPTKKGSFSLDPQRQHPVPEPYPEPEPVQTEINTVYAAVQKMQAPVHSPTAGPCTIYELAGPVGNHSHQSAYPERTSGFNS